MNEDFLGGRYQLRTVLGRGGMAVVWRADDQRLGRPVAVKVLDRAGLTDTSMLARFDREARTVARLAHPNIVTVHDVGVDDSVPYLVMELVDGESLADLLTRGPLEVGEAVRITGQICTALEAAHAAAVIHRDIKPANILITTTGAVKVCDFGIAHAPHGAQTSLTGPALAVGTSEYMAPEQVAGGPVDHRADLYALGCVLYAMLTGHPPFSGETPIRVAWQHLHETPTPVAAVRSGVPDELSTLVDRLLAKDPADRPASAAQVRALLPQMSGVSTKTFVAPVADLTGQPPPPIRASAAVPSRTQTMPVVDYFDAPPTRGRSRPGPVWVAAMALAAVAIVVLTIIAITRGRPESQAGPSTTPQTTSTQAPSTPASASASSAPPAGSPSDAISAIQAAIQSQVQAGQLDRDVARDLSHQLNDIEHQVNHDNGDKSAGQVDDLRHKLDQARDDGKITDIGYNALASSVDQLAASLPSPTDDNQG